MHRHRSNWSAVVVLGLCGLAPAACKNAPPEPEPAAAKEPSTTPASTTTPAAAATKPSNAPTIPAAFTTSADPTGGKFSLADATKGLAGSGPLIATIATNLGTLECKLFDDKAPNTVANFVGLARGVRPWQDPATKQWVNRPLYDGTTFHRIIKGFMIQGGDPLGNGTGEPGYTIPDENWPGAKHDHAGLLCMANRGKDTNGAQFFILDAAASYLDGGYTIFGECAPVDVIHTIASVATNRARGDKPLSPVVMKRVTISHGKK